MGNGAEEAALAIIGRDRLWVKGINVCVLRILRVEGENGGQTLAGHVPVELGLRVDALSTRTLLGFGREGVRIVS